ncbi:ArsR family transcriptional regulator [Streptomyces sp. NBC_00090]|uniref:ArsR/SmtB family transcription factor n=1 Tax=Streptomyces sp. NBC_00090 TaxID=2903619 RepID=UPI00324B9BD4
MPTPRATGGDRVPPHPDIRAIDLQQVLEALVDPVRRQIVAELYAAGEDLACGAIALPVSKSTATHHFHVLRDAGLIRQHYAGTSRMNSLRGEEFDARFPGLLLAVVTAHGRDGRGTDAEKRGE